MDGSVFVEGLPLLVLVGVFVSLVIVEVGLPGLLSLLVLPLFMGLLVIILLLVIVGFSLLMLRGWSGLFLLGFWLRCLLFLLVILIIIVLFVLLIILVEFVINFLLHIEISVLIIIIVLFLSSSCQCEDCLLLLCRLNHFRFGDNCLALRLCFWFSLRFTFQFLLIFLFLPLLLFRLCFILGIHFIRLIEPRDVQCSIALIHHCYPIEEGDEQIDGSMWVFSCQVGNEYLLTVLHCPQRSALFGGGCQYDVGDGEDFSLGGFCLLG